MATPEERAALEWLEGYAGTMWTGANHARTLKDMLAQPRLPEKADQEALRAMAATQHGALFLYQWEEAYNALFTYLTKPGPHKQLVPSP